MFDGEDDVIFCIDIKTRGRSMIYNGILSIGVCVGSATEDKVLDKVRFDFMPLDHLQKMEGRCWDEFWSKHEDVFIILEKNAGHAMKQIERFRMYLDMWHRWYKNVYIVSDNPAFDFAFINYYLDVAKLMPLSYKKVVEDEVEKEVYVPLHDSDSYARGMMHQHFDNPWTDDRALIKHLKKEKELNKDSHDHMPENDAEFIYRLHFQMVKH